MLWAGIAVLPVLVSACSDDDDATSITVTIGADSTTVPSEIDAGVVEVTLEGDAGAESEVDFTRVAEGTTEEQFTGMMIGVVSGGPIPEILEDNAGVVAGPTPASVISNRAHTSSGAREPMPANNRHSSSARRP